MQLSDSYYTYKVGNSIHSEWADNWGDILAKFPTAKLISQTS